MLFAPKRGGRLNPKEHQTHDLRPTIGFGTTTASTGKEESKTILTFPVDKLRIL